MVAKCKRVLVVDDEDVVCRSYERVLAGAGFEVGTAHSGPEALDRLRTRDYDVMLADLKMPGMDGLQVIEKARESRPGLPVVVITGFPSQDTLEQAARLGVTDYLTKPIAPDVLTHATMQALSAEPWTGTAPYLGPQPAVAAMPFPVTLPTGTLLWPERAEPMPVPRAAEAAVAAPAAEPAAWRTVVHLALAPVISIAYVMFLPLVGFAVFLGLGAKALYKKLAPKAVQEA